MIKQIDFRNIPSDIIRTNCGEFVSDFFSNLKRVKSQFHVVDVSFYNVLVSSAVMVTCSVTKKEKTFPAKPGELHLPLHCIEKEFANYRREYYKNKKMVKRQTRLLQNAKKCNIN